MKKVYRVLFSISLLTFLASFESMAQTRLQNPKVQVLSPDNVASKAISTPAPHITVIQHNKMPAHWILLTPSEFDALSKEEQQNAVSKPDIYIVTNEDKERTVMALQRQETVTNLILQQPLKK
jgi:hypothetical protein